MYASDKQDFADLKTALTESKTEYYTFGLREENTKKDVVRAASFFGEAGVYQNLKEQNENMANIATLVPRSLSRLTKRKT